MEGKPGAVSVVAVAQAGLTAVSPLGTLARGFAIVRDGDGHLIRSVTQARPGEAITIQVSDGVLGGRIDGQGRASG